MAGLVDVVRMSNSELNKLALGVDLTHLGLNLTVSEPLYQSFVSPFSDAPTQSEPEFKLPACYMLAAQQQTVPVMDGRMNTLSEESLFYIFYAFPGDRLQLLAARELYVAVRLAASGAARRSLTRRTALRCVRVRMHRNQREWRYHKEERAWFSRVPEAEQTTKKQPQSERGSYYYWDVSLWRKERKDDYVLVYAALDLPGKQVPPPGVGAPAPGMGGVAPPPQQQQQPQQPQMSAVQPQQQQQQQPSQALPPQGLPPGLAQPMSMPMQGQAPPPQLQPQAGRMMGMGVRM